MKDEFFINIILPVWLIILIVSTSFLKDKELYEIGEKLLFFQILLFIYFNDFDGG